MWGGTSTLHGQPTLSRACEASAGMSCRAQRPMVHRFAAGLAANARGDAIALLQRFLELKTTNGDTRLRSVYVSPLT